MFIELTGLKNTKVFIKINEIVCIYENARGTIVVTPFEKLTVKECPSDIYLEINDYQLGQSLNIINGI